MKLPFEFTETIGRVARLYPQTLDVFFRHGVDFCCGGHKTIHDAAAAAGADEQAMKAELESAIERKADMGNRTTFTAKSLDKNATPGAVLHHVVANHHQFLRQELPAIDELTATIEQVHGENHPELHQVRTLFLQLSHELSAHLEKEEWEVFPAIWRFEKDGSGEKAARAGILELRAEHEMAGQLLFELRRITQDYQVPEDGCGTYQLTYQKLAALEANTFDHIHLENNVAFTDL